MVALSENVRRLRLQRKMTQKDLADAIGTAIPRICELEKGRTNPTLTTIEALAKALATTPAKLLAEKKATK